MTPAAVRRHAGQDQQEQDMQASRRAFLQATAAAAGAAGVAAADTNAIVDGPGTSGFSPVPLQGHGSFEDLAKAGLSEAMAAAVPQAPRGSCICWGIPFRIDRPILLKDAPVTESIGRTKAEWLVFAHTSDFTLPVKDARGLIKPMRGEGYLGEHLADYYIVYADGTEVRAEIRRRHHLSTWRRIWGENCFQAVAHRKPHPLRSARDQPTILVDAGVRWGTAETRVMPKDGGRWVNWLWAWQNPNPEKEIAALRFVPKASVTIISAVSAGRATAEPLRWETRRKAILKLPEGATFDFNVDGQGQWKQIRLDMGQLISAEPRKVYPNREWDATYNNKVPEVLAREVLIEYSAHPDAAFHLDDGTRIPVSALRDGPGKGALVPVAPATQAVRIRVREKSSGKLTPVKLHIHGESGEYLPPVDRHRQPNGGWFEDYAPEFQNQGRHYCVYIAGETLVQLPLGNVYLEVSKGFEIRPIRRTIRIEASTETIDLTIERLLPWRERGWVTADTHVHFLSPSTAQLEGAAEGVNVVNL
ncbi:MAG: twin-arginine translocation signal domain-containing protein, partial [Candidatus Solibacter sp.]|nr:twin-arginine translocation signal domain-containing protein [Candidatus Solibacter sp.]